jgi:RND family efflux transporter MFP subunit
VKHKVLPAVIMVALATPASAGTFDCVIQPRRLIELRSPVEGMIERIHVERGDAVQKGQVLVELDAGVEAANAEFAKFRADMQSPLRSAESRVEFSSKKFARKDDLHQKAFVSAQERDEAATEKRLAEMSQLEAMENQRLAQLELRRASEQLRLRTIRSPFEGVVVDRMMNPGEVADTADARRLILKLAEMDVLYVEVILPVETYRSVKLGMNVDVLPDAPISGNYTARVKVIDKVLDAASGTFGVRLEMANPRRELPAGVKCRAKFSGIDVTGGPRGLSAGARSAANPGGAVPTVRPAVQQELRDRTPAILDARMPSIHPVTGGR